MYVQSQRKTFKNLLDYLAFRFNSFGNNACQDALELMKSNLHKTPGKVSRNC